MSKFNIGDTVWQAHAGQSQIWIICPECLGSGRLLVILGDGTEVSIACVCCERGYEGSPGKLSTYDFVAEAYQVTITGVESHMTEGKLKTRYSVGCYSGEEENIFATKEEALSRASFLKSLQHIEEDKRMKYKEKQAKTWAWNVAYHRRALREAQRQIEYHTAKLNTVPKNLKEAEKY